METNAGAADAHIHPPLLDILIFSIHDWQFATFTLAPTHTAVIPQRVGLHHLGNFLHSSQVRNSSGSTVVIQLTHQRTNLPVEADGLMVICMLWCIAAFIRARAPPAARWKFSLFLAPCSVCCVEKRLSVIYYARWGPRAILSERHRWPFIFYEQTRRGAIQ